MRGVRGAVIVLLNEIRRARRGEPVSDENKRLSENEFSRFSSSELIRAATLVEQGRLSSRYAPATLGRVRGPDVPSLVEAMLAAGLGQET